MNTLTVHADDSGARISRHIYGHFSEHLGRCIYDGFYVGEGSDIANVRGLRTDAIEALKAIQIPNLRWPGGCFADEYHWRDGIGPQEKRPTMINTHWGGVTENNHFGTHEFMDLIEQLGCEPYICGNVGSGTVQEMAEWVEYLTFDGVSPRADERRRNGREAPWKVTYWGVGNENWGCGGHMRVEYYADLYRRFATYCRNYDGNRLYKIAGGPNVDDYHWTEVLMQRIPYGQMHGLSLHYYATDWNNKGPATGFDEAGWFKQLQLARRMEELLERHGAIMDVYDPKRRIGLIVDEWGSWYDVEPGTNPGFLYQQNTLRDALIAGITLNAFHRHAHRVHMANLAQTMNVLQAVLLTDGKALIKTPTYHVFDLYRPHQDATQLPATLRCTEYALDGKSQPVLSVSASRDDAGVVHVSLCNLHASAAQPLTLRLTGVAPAGVSGRIVTAETLDAHNTATAPETVGVRPFDGARLAGDTVTVELPARSVTTLALR